MKIAYVKPPVSKEQKAKLLKTHDKILDERFKPKEPKKARKPKAETED